MSTFAITLKKLLQEKNMKQNELARLTKINKSSISEYLSGNYQPKYKNILKIAEVLNVSRLHAYITFEHGRHILRDANSLNGTSVNDRPITNFCLCPGDIIQIGNTRIVYDLI